MWVLSMHKAGWQTRSEAASATNENVQYDNKEPQPKEEQMSLVGLLMIAAFAYMTCDVIGTAVEKNKERRGE